MIVGSVFVMKNRKGRGTVENTRIESSPDNDHYDENISALDVSILLPPSAPDPCPVSSHFPIQIIIGILRIITTKSNLFATVLGGWNCYWIEGGGLW